MQEESTESHWAAIAFMTTPEFLYFELYLLIINIANLFFFGSAIKAIRAAYINKEQLR